MSNAMVPLKGKLPAVFATVNAVAAADDLSANVISGFPLISFRGKVWRIRKSGDEVSYVDTDGNAVPNIEVVFLKANPNVSKIFYTKGYTEGDSTPPSCWSADGKRPDKEVPEPVNDSCVTCPNNVWGSKITEAGQKGRLCGDSRRVAVAFLGELDDKGEDAHKFLLRIPAASLNPLKEFADKVLKPNGVPYYAVAIKLGFDAAAQYPKITFKASRMLTDEEASVVAAMRESDEVNRILAKSEELAEEAAAAPPAEVIPPAPKKAAEPPPPPMPKPKAVKPKPVADEPEPAPKVKPSTTEFDAMLKNILNT